MKDDSISRQAAIDAVSDGLKRTFVEHEDIARKMISKLPSAQSDVPITDAGNIISRQNTITAIRDYMVNPKVAISEHPDDILKYNSGLLSAIQAVNDMPSVQPEPHEIGYSECANSMLKMWIDNVLTDGEYSHIMDKLNAYWAERSTDEQTD